MMAAVPNMHNKVMRSVARQRVGEGEKFLAQETQKFSAPNPQRNCGRRSHWPVPSAVGCIPGSSRKRTMAVMPIPVRLLRIVGLQFDADRNALGRAGSS